MQNHGSPSQVLLEGQVSETAQPSTPLRGHSRAPAALRSADFHLYPPQGRAQVIQHLAVLRTIPLPMLPILLRELITYDWKFPRERERLDAQLSWLARMPVPQRAALFAPFAALPMAPALAQTDWLNDPAAYMEQLSADLWSSSTMPQFRAASEAYTTALNAATPSVLPLMPRVCLVILDEDLRSEDGHPASFAQLRKRGVTLTGIDPTHGAEQLQARLEARASAAHSPFAHWYVDGGTPARTLHPAVAATSYNELAPVRQRLLSRAQETIASTRSGPEELRSLMARFTPADAGFAPARDATLTHFELALLTEGSGTQIFATTYVQWAAREILRRAEPATLLLRFRARQRQQGINELLSGSASLGPDLPGSLVDAEQATYTTWLNLLRLPGAERSVLLAWQAGSTTAVALGPGLPSGATSHVNGDLNHALDQLT